MLRDPPTGPSVPTSNKIAGHGLPVPEGLVMALRQRTRGLHAEAERAGVIRDLLRGTANRTAYALLLRNLLPVYQALERALDRHRGTTLLARLARPEVYRAAAIEADLTLLAGRAWQDLLPLLESGRGYANRVAASASGDGARLLAHAYTRFLGDLSGGRVMAARLSAIFTPQSAALRFYEFPGIADLAAFKVAYLADLDRAGSLVADQQPIIEEAADAFLCNIHIAKEVGAYARADLLR